MAFAEEAVVVAGDEVGFDLAHGVEHDADDDQTRKARPGMAPGRRETRLMEAPMSPTLPSTRVLANLVAHRERGGFPMIGKYFSNGWKISGDFSNDWKKFSRVFQRLEKFFTGTKILLRGLSP